MGRPVRLPGTRAAGGGGRPGRPRRRTAQWRETPSGRSLAPARKRSAMSGPVTPAWASVNTLASLKYTAMASAGPERWPCPCTAVPRRGVRPRRSTRPSPTYWLRSGPYRSSIEVSCHLRARRAPGTTTEPRPRSRKNHRSLRSAVLTVTPPRRRVERSPVGPAGSRGRLPQRTHPQPTATRRQQPGRHDARRSAFPS